MASSLSNDGVHHVNYSASKFLQSISAECSVTYGSTQGNASAAPQLPISAKVSLIDAQIDNLETQIQHTIQSHSAQLKQRAASSRAVNHNLNELWQSINQTSSRIVAIPTAISPAVSEYHDALAQSKKQELLVSILSNLVAALKQLELMESMVANRDVASIESHLPQVGAILEPLIEIEALQQLATVVELQRRFQHVKEQHAALVETSHQSATQSRAVDMKGTQQTSAPPYQVANPLSSSSSILDTARKLIISKSVDGGWKSLVVPSPHHIVAPSSESQEPPLLNESPFMPVREELAPSPSPLIRPASPLTRNSSTSSNMASRRQKAKLGARVLRPQDQLGSGPFDEQEEDGSGWDLDDDDDDDIAMTAAGPSSVAIHVSSSNSSLQRAALAMQHEEDPDEAWGLEEEINNPTTPSPARKGHRPNPSIAQKHNEEGAWGLEEDLDDDLVSQPAFQIGESATRSSLSIDTKQNFSPSPTPSFSSAAQQLDSNDEDDAWGIEDNDHEEPIQDLLVPSRSTNEVATPMPSQHSEQNVWGTDITPAIALPLQVPSPDAVGEQPANRSVSEVSASETQAKAAPLEKQEEVCTISQRSVDLVRLAQQTMDEGIRLLEQPSPDRPDLMLATVGDIFELHRSLMPVAHGEVLRDVPSLAMQFFNDCEYLARELSVLIETRHSRIEIMWNQRDATAAIKWREIGVTKLRQQALLTRSLGQRWFEAQITAQSKVLTDTLLEADGFARTFDDNRFRRCEKCVLQVVQTLEQLGNAWRPILTPSHFSPAMGKLVDLVFQKVLHDVLDLEDIGESESEKIAGLIKTLGGLESLFTDVRTQQSSAPLHVPSWFKTSYLIEILTGSLVDIDFLAFEAKALVDYSRRELSGLIKALFSDTANRSKLLHKIEAAPGDILAR